MYDRYYLSWLYLEQEQEGNEQWSATLHLLKLH